MRTVLFLHSAGSQAKGQGSRAFAERLAADLGPRYAVAYPRMPNPEAPSYPKWQGALARALARLDGRAPILVVGHSLGGSVLLKYLSEGGAAPPIAGLALVATPYWGAPGWEVEEFRLARGFAARLPPIPWMGLYQSRDDDSVAYRHLARYARALKGAVVRPQEGMGHAFAEGLPELVADLHALGAIGRARRRA